MLFNFNIIDEGIDDTPVTKEQTAAQVDYDIKRDYHVNVNTYSINVNFNVSTNVI